ncbi:MULTISPECIES: SH3 domain-containing C40 family peptidase [unclassified Campylobacter]|uniref:SH3 domain-containing C40 family peptidase n=1 Tax=unclassified Campylobacter TaxID=2593542 RepID=UPI0012383684|nr:MULTISPECIES: SH3 domain-containing C40 family peptidase [unclassified Campylobacter]KAA6227194.1 hypothetical protein FMM57_04455 [Campylobacter sp. LR286c]KAA6227932.1 hypothetical protein FMM54_02020 [Campylobacter sp. LR185c]KAA6228341.1 hypothetical protein FMM55_01830 [Campylobacter sp. LR196d]KAA6229342.1 hypothetical protein FMM58_08265 [Campylobacter sp. LR291e]KAA6231148.1 hypothetical protein FMM56_05530 [Campylobacter sp. LR264d]
MKYFLLFFLLFFVACSSKTTQNQELSLNTTQEVSLEEISQQEEAEEILSEEEKEIEKKHYTGLEFEQNVSILPILQTSFKNNSQNYKSYFFRPWHSSFKNIKSKNLFWSFKSYKNPKNRYFFFNKQRIPKSWFNTQINNANIKAFGSVNKKALIIQNTMLKNFPTTQAILKNPFFENEGIPFDYANDNVLNAGSPVLISHYTKDKKFAYVMAESGFGFVLTKNLELFTDTRANTYENLNFITPIKEKVPVYSENNKFFFETRIGAIYPYYKSDDKFYYGKIGPKKYKISKKNAQKFPISFQELNVKNQISQMLSLPYGWGGYAFERDCSMLTREFFTAFGIYLPRNSASQSKFAKNYDISFLDNERKKEFIRMFAKPYLTLMYLKGHIMLYIGQIDNEPSVLHSVWGLRRGSMGHGRFLIAKSALTTLEIGKGLISPENSLLYRLKELSFVNLDEDEQMEIENYLDSIKNLNVSK